MNRLILGATVVLVAMVFVILHYQNKSLSGSVKNEETQNTEPSQYYSASKAFNESYEREKALKTNVENQGQYQKIGGEPELNVSTLEQSSRMEEIMRKEKSQLHEEHSEAGQNKVASPRAQQFSSPHTEPRLAHRAGMKFTVGAINPLGNPFEIYDAAALESSAAVNDMSGNNPQSPEGSEKHLNPFNNINAAWGRFQALVVGDDVRR